MSLKWGMSFFSITNGNGQVPFSQNGAISIFLCLLVLTYAYVSEKSSRVCWIIFWEVFSKKIVVWLFACFSYYRSSFFKGYSNLIDFLDNICSKRVLPVENRKSEYHHEILHIQIIFGTKFQFKLKILIFWPNLP